MGCDKFLLEEGVRPADIHRRMSTLYGSVNSLSQSKVYKWVETFKSARTSVSDKAPGSP